MSSGAETSQRFDLESPVEHFEGRNVDARPAMEALASRDPGTESLERPL